MDNSEKINRGVNVSSSEWEEYQKIFEQQPQFNPSRQNRESAPAEQVEREARQPEQIEQPERVKAKTILKKVAAIIIMAGVVTSSVSIAADFRDKEKKDFIKNHNLNKYDVTKTMTGLSNDVVWEKDGVKYTASDINEDRVIDVLQRKETRQSYEDGSGQSFVDRGSKAQIETQIPIEEFDAEEVTEQLDEIAQNPPEQQ